jgi:hypothetical protein
VVWPGVEAAFGRGPPNGSHFALSRTRNCLVERTHLLLSAPEELETRAIRATRMGSESLAWRIVSNEETRAQSLLVT